jgi:6-phosphogluconolactonase
MNVTVRRFDDREELSRAVAELFATTAERAIASRGRFSALLSGGETPRRAYEILGNEPLRSRVPWQGVHLFWGDERFVPATHPASNTLMVRTALLDRVPLPEVQIHPIICDDDPERAAGRYEALLRSHFPDGVARFDLALLGLGEDGHTASLFPGSPSLDERLRWVTATRREGEEFMRVTLTPPPLNQADLALFLVSGAGKADVVWRVLEGPFTPRLLPAQLIRPSHGKVAWMVDRGAAALLKSSFPAA